MGATEQEVQRINLVWKTIFIIVPTVAFITVLPYSPKSSSAITSAGEVAGRIGYSIGVALGLVAVVGIAFGFSKLLMKKCNASTKGSFATGFGISVAIWLAVAALLIALGEK